MSPLDARPVAGDVAPPFSLRDAGGVERSLSAVAGRWLVLYFYPKDDTPGCTIEACEFRDAERELHAAGAIVWGVSPDDEASKAAFRDKFQLNFPILADVGHHVAEAYGVWGERTVGDRTFTGTHRVTFLINPQGRVARVWGSVTPTGHAAEVLAEIEAQRA
ncbi:MAG: peroxiredoxin [Candidatus Limnocylindrus sp.]